MTLMIRAKINIWFTIKSPLLLRASAIHRSVISDDLSISRLKKLNARNIYQVGMMSDVNLLRSTFEVVRPEGREAPLFKNYRGKAFAGLDHRGRSSTIIDENFATTSACKAITPAIPSGLAS